MEKTAELIDQEVSVLIDKAYKRTKEILVKNQHLLKQLAELLLEKEVIFKEDLERIFGVRPFTKAEDVVGKKPPENGAAQLPTNGVGNTLKEEPKNQEQNGNGTSAQSASAPSETKADTEKPATLFFTKS